MNRLHHIMCLFSCFVIGWLASEYAGRAVAAEGERSRPAYMIISVNEIRPDKMGAYKEAVRPVAQSQAGGIELLAISQQEDIQLLEGDWPFPGLLLIEKYESMDALKRFWFSEDYQEAKKLRDGHADVNFFVAIEGRP